QRYLFNDVISVIKSNKKETVYSVKVDSNCHSFVANGFLNHNTEARLTKIAEGLLVDIDKNTVNFQDNFDGSLKEPVVLPAKLPNLLINGSSGIAVGMATNIPPHNIVEIIDGVVTLIDNPDATVRDLMEHVKGPDFPTGGTICGRSGIMQAYNSGKGRVLIRAKTRIEEGKNREVIIVDEIPYMVNKSQLIEQIANLIRDKRIIGISDLRDESDRTGMRIVIELKQGVNSDVLLNQLYKHSRLQVTFGIIMLALVNNEPKVLNLKEVLQHYIDHRQVVVRRRTDFELKKAEDRAHILEGLIVALNNIDDVVQKIKASKDVETAKQMLINDYSLTEKQAKAILEMRLQKLASLEREKINQEHANLMKVIEELKAILADEQMILNIIKSELAELREKYGDGRRTNIIESNDVCIEMEDLIADEKMIVTVTHAGYVKRVPIDTYKIQRRGGKGIIAAGTRDEDWVEDVFVSSTHSYILLFTDKGNVHWLKVYNIPEGTRQSRGKAIVNLVDLRGEKVTAIVPVKEFDSSHYLILATKKGIVKKTNLTAYSRPRQGGIIAIVLDQSDELIDAMLTDGTKHVLLATRNGLAIRFDERDARPIGRASKGVRGINLKSGDEVVDMVVADDERSLFTITESGKGKRTDMKEYRQIGRGGVGVINIQTSKGKVVAVKSVRDIDDIMFISQNGIMIRVAAKGISKMGRNTQGVRVMRVAAGDKAVAAAKIINEEEQVEVQVEEEEKKEVSIPEGKTDEELVAEQMKESLHEKDVVNGNGDEGSEEEETVVEKSDEEMPVEETKSEEELNVDEDKEDSDGSSAEAAVIDENSDDSSVNESAVEEDSEPEENSEK
ncbi:DNA gyrase subunit A, partial [Nanoarchaeota archaeon]